MLEWLLALGALAVFLALLPRMLRKTKGTRLKGGASGVVMGLGFAFAALFDPKSAQATELIAQKREDAEDEDSGAPPERYRHPEIGR